MMQFSLISLIPGLIRNLQDCADPDLDNYEKKLVKPTSLKSSDRNSLLTYMGLPLQIFGKVIQLEKQLAQIYTDLFSGQLIWTLYPFTAT
jgi:Transport protein Avl9